jgi:PAS domain S-box-containing protein
VPDRRAASPADRTDAGGRAPAGPLSAVLEASQRGILVLDDARRCIDANETACRIMGVSRERVTGSRAEDFAPPAVHARAEALWREFLPNGLHGGECSIVSEGGDRLRVRLWWVANVLPGNHVVVLDVPAAAGERSGRADPQPALTPRQRDVLTLVAHGLTTAEMARHLGMSAETAKKHCQNAMEKLGAGTRAQAVALALASGDIVLREA